MKITRIIVSCFLVLTLNLAFTACFQTVPTPAPTSSAAKVGSDAQALFVQALQDYASYKAGNIGLLYSLSAGSAAYRDIITSSDDIKQLIADWVGQSGDSKVLADRLARIFAATPGTPATKVTQLATAASNVAVNANVNP